MGCCASSGNSQIGESLPSPPPGGDAFLEEETVVKEVMSETPAAIIPARRSQKDQDSRQIESPFIKIAPLLDYSRAAPKLQHQNGGKRPPYAAYVAGNEELSEEFSEIGSNVSEGVSASAEKRGNELRGSGHQRSPARSRNRSLSGEVKRERPVGRSPGRRSELSPNRVAPSGYARKKDNGENSGRRSRSPVTRSEHMPFRTGSGQGQAQPGRKAGRSPGRVGSGLGERTRKEVDEGGEAAKWAPTSNELLENPLVSLECFIFL